MVAADAGLGDHQGVAPAGHRGVEVPGVELHRRAAVGDAQQLGVARAQQLALERPGALEQRTRVIGAAREHVVVGEAEQGARGLQRVVAVEALGEPQGPLAVRARGVELTAVVEEVAGGAREVDVLAARGQARGQALGDLQPALALVVMREHDAGDGGEVGGGGQGQAVVAGEQGEAGGGEQREACGLRLAGVVEGVAERELQLGLGGGVLEGDLLLCAAEGDGLLVLAGAGEGVHAGERGSDRLGGGWRRIGGAAGAGVLAVLGPRQGARRLDSATQDLVVGLGPQLGARAELAGLAIEAGQLEVERGLGLAVMLVGVGAGAGPGGEPAGLPVVDEAHDLGPAGGLIAARERGRAGAAQRRVPLAREQVEVAGAGGDRIVGVRDRGRRDAAEQTEAHRGEGPASSRSAIDRGERGEQRRHVGEALVGVDREPATQRGGDAIGYPHVARRRPQLALQDAGRQRGEVVAGERSLAVHGLPQGDAEAELIGPRIDLARHELLGRHVGRRAEQHAGGGEVQRRLAASGVGEHRGVLAADGLRRLVVGGGAGDAEVEDARVCGAPCLDARPARCRA